MIIQNYLKNKYQQKIGMNNHPYLTIKYIYKININDYLPNFKLIKPPTQPPKPMIPAML